MVSCWLKFIGRDFLWGLIGKSFVVRRAPRLHPTRPLAERNAQGVGGECPVLRSVFRTGVSLGFGLVLRRRVVRYAYFGVSQRRKGAKVEVKQLPFT